MPFHGTDRAPKFDGTTDNLTEFIDVYEQLADKAGLQGLDRIKGLPEAQESNYDVFMKEIKVMYPGWDGKRRYTPADLQALTREYAQKPMFSGQELSAYLRVFRKIMQPLLNEDRIGEAERDHIFMEGIPSEVQAPIRMRLMIKHPDHYPHDPYPFMQVYAAGQFILPANAPLPTTAPSAQNTILTLSATAPSAHTPSARAPSTCAFHTHAFRTHAFHTCAFHACANTYARNRSLSSGLFYRASSEVVLDKRPPVPTLTPCVRTSLTPCACAFLAPHACAFLAPHACAFPTPYACTFPVPSCDSRASEPSTAPPCKAILDCITLDHELEHVLVKRTASASSPSSSIPSPSQSPSSSALSPPIVPIVRDDSKHLLHTNTPLETCSPITIAPPIVRDDSKHLLHNNAPIVDIIMPSLETRPPIASLKEEILPVTPLLSPLSLLASSEVRDDPKHQLCLSAPIEEPSTTSEA
ncbi:hypothetical protein BD769DRAFT_1672989 [Suillus cothurnatus]|nr:hypothetical protein BD769DRAFT_1672989 [Suillus cothurnatus]